MSHETSSNFLPIEKLRQRLDLVQTDDRQWQAKCPAHDDNRASLSVYTSAPGGIALIHCHAGCEPADVMAAIGLTVRDLFAPRDDHQEAAKPEIEATYDYCDANGELLFQAVRMRPKDFRQRRPKPGSEGKWLWNVKGCPIIPYRLSELLAADPSVPVFVVEGEKDVERLRSLGLIATCNAGGAGKWKREHAEFLVDRHVVILPDNDEAGQKHADQVARSLTSKAASIKVVELLDLPRKGDVSDWLNAGGTAEVLQALVEAAPPCEPPQGDEANLPEVPLPGNEQTISNAGQTLGKLLAVKQSHFIRGGGVVRVSTDERGFPMLAEVRPAGLASDFERVASLVKVSEGKDGPESRPATCSEQVAKLVLAAETFRTELPPLRVLAQCPVLVEREGELAEIVGYDRASGILTEGPQPDEVSLDEASRLLNGLLAGFRFATLADRSRAMAALITPGLVLGGLLPGRAPVDLGEADQSQTGKGFRNKVTAAIYRHTPVAISQQHAGVGGLEESFDRALIAGKTFIALDNVRGKVDSQKIESFLTEDTYYARAAYMPNTEIDPRRVYVMFTSNKADMTTDLANRSSCVRLLKQTDGFEYPTYPEGDILQHVRARQPLYLGAVFAVIRAWHAAGKPRSKESRHDFRAWAQTLDWIVQNLLGCEPLLDGHRETQRRMTNPALNWFRDVALAVVQQRREGDWLIAADLVDIIDADGEIKLPGLKDGADLDSETTRKSVLQHTGRKLKQCFGDHDRVELDQFVIDRECTLDSDSRPRNHYRVCQRLPADLPPDAPREPQNISGEPRESLFDGTSPTTKNTKPADEPPDSPLTSPLMISRESADPPDVSSSTYTRGRTHDTLPPILNVLWDHQRVIGDDASSEVVDGNQPEPRETMLL